MKRLSETDKWKDLWYVELSPNAKILLVYLYDNCNEAGFIDYQCKLFIAQLNMKKEELESALIELKPSLLSNGKSKLFIKDYLNHQLKLPINKKTEEGMWILNKLTSNLLTFNNDVSIKTLIDTAEKKGVPRNIDVKKTATKRPTKPFVAPTFDEWETEYYNQFPNPNKNDITSLYNHYVSVDWTVGKNNRPMRNWQSALAKNGKSQNSSNLEGTKTGKILKVDSNTKLMK